MGYDVEIGIVYGLLRRGFPKSGGTFLGCPLGKESCVLAWALEPLLEAILQEYTIE